MRHLLAPYVFGLALVLAGCGTTEQTVENRHPVANADTAEVDAGEAVAIRVLDNDTDADGDDLAIDPTAITISGGVIEEVDAEEGTITFRAPEQTGTYTISYFVTDGKAPRYADSTFGTVTVVVR